jgi:hypothetical protein
MRLEKNVKILQLKRRSLPFFREAIYVLNEIILISYRRRNLQSVVDLAKLTEIFLVNPNVRYIGAVDKHDNVRFSKMRA